MSNMQSRAQDLQVFWEDEHSKDDDWPQPESVLSLDFDGLPRSRFKDDVWDFTAHHHKSFKTTFSLNYSLAAQNAEKIKHQHKLILYIFWAKHQDLIPTFRARLLAIKRLVEYCINNNVLPFEVLASTSAATHFVNSFNGKESKIRYDATKGLRAALGILIRLSSIYGEKIPAVSVGVYHYLDDVANNSKSPDTSQFKLIPSRIYVEFINQSFQFISDFKENELPTIEAFLKTRRSLIEEKIIQRFGDTSGDLRTQSSKIKHMQPTVPTLLEEQGAYASLLAIGLNADHQKAMKSISKRLTEVQAISTMLIHAFTGMRISEGECLPLNAYGEFDCLGKKIPTLTGYHSKFSSDSKNITSWVTAHSIKPVVDLCRSLTILAIECIHLNDINDFDENHIPLFISISGIIKNRTSGLFEYAIARRSSFDFSGVLPNPKLFELQDSDINELTEFNPLSMDENLIVGNKWGFQSHQFRRSLAVYAARSGYVGISSLRTQFKQLGDQMAAYYAESSAFAKDLIFTEDLRKFAEEFNDEAVQVEVDRIHKEVVDTSEILFAGLGNWLQKKKTTGDLPEIYTDRDKTTKGVKEGRIRYKETPLGGCSKLERCDRVVITPIFGCIGCPDSIFADRAVPVLEETKQKLIRQREGIKPDSPFYRALSNEIAEIDKLLLKRNQHQEEKEIVWHKRIEA